MYGRSSSAVWGETANLTVMHHERVPKFSDEVKVSLPPVLSHKHHILFTFYHLSCKKRGKNDSSDSNLSPIGYAFLPVYEKQK